MLKIAESLSNADTYQRKNLITVILIGRSKIMYAQCMNGMNLQKTFLQNLSFENTYLEL